LHWNTFLNMGENGNNYEENDNIDKESGDHRSFSYIFAVFLGFSV